MATGTSHVLVAGGGIGGIAAALALVRRGFSVKVLEQAPQLGEIGAGIQLGPNGFAAFDALGIGEIARARAVYTDEMVMHDALDEKLVASRQRLSSGWKSDIQRRHCCPQAPKIASACVRSRR